MSKGRTFEFEFGGQESFEVEFYLIEFHDNFIMDISHEIPHLSGDSLTTFSNLGMNYVISMKRFETEKLQIYVLDKTDITFQMEIQVAKVGCPDANGLFGKQRFQAISNVFMNSF